MTASSNFNKKEEYENFFKTTSENKVNYEEEISNLKKELRQKIKERNKSQEESILLQNKVLALKTVENKAIKKIDITKKSLNTIESIRKDLLANKITAEEKKCSQEKQLEIKKQKVQQEKAKTQSFLKEISISTVKKKHKEKTQLIQEKKNIIRMKNIQIQEEEEKNKQICIKVKSSKINYIDKKQKLAEEKKQKIKNDILAKLNQEINFHKSLSSTNKKLKEEEVNIKGNLKTIESTNLDDGKILL